MTAVLVLIGLLLVGAGALALGSPDTMWAVTRFRNRAEGLASERTETWEGFNKWGGVLAIAFGSLSLVGAVGTGISAHAHSKQLTLLDAIDIFQLAIAGPGETGKTLWRYCSFRQ